MSYLIRREILIVCPRNWQAYICRGMFSSVENYRVFYIVLISSYKFYLIMAKPFLKGVNDCVDDAHAGFFLNCDRGCLRNVFGCP